LLTLVHPTHSSRICTVLFPPPSLPPIVNSSLLLAPLQLAFGWFWADYVIW
jgi:hypothetical protein